MELCFPARSPNITASGHDQRGRGSQVYRRVMRTALAIALGLLVALWVWWRFIRVARPAFPPLAIAEDDPLMRSAMQRARETMDVFRTLHGQPHRDARLKVPFLTNGGVLEYLWAEVRTISGADVEVLYLTPPVSHQGRLERIHTHPLTDAVDWHIELPDGSYRGGFTMRVMFIRGREQWGSLPPELEAEEEKYSANDPGQRT